MFKEIKIIEQHFHRKSNKKEVVKEIKNSNDILGSEELSKISNKYHLVSSQNLSYRCPHYEKVIIVITTYLFSDSI